MLSLHCVVLLELTLDGRRIANSKLCLTPQHLRIAEDTAAYFLRAKTKKEKRFANTELTRFPDFLRLKMAAEDYRFRTATVRCPGCCSNTGSQSRHDFKQSDGCLRGN